MKEPAYHSTCPRTVLTLTISKIRYSLKPVKPETILLQKHSESEVTLLEPFVALESDEEFWRIHQMDLAVGN
jgi:hypothetical protein